jgi:acyl-CoA thioester hydrolase
MPLTHERNFRVRHYECDAYGHMNNANYLRYMQETAFDASTAAGYDLSRYDELGTIWLIRETDIEYLHPLRYDDRVRVKTWVEDFRRIRSRRAYEFSLVETGEMVARASTDWVYLAQVTGRPQAIPAEMMAAFFPEGVPEEAPPRKRFAEPPAPPLGVFRQRRRVEWRDIDPMNHVNNATYLSYIDDCGVSVTVAHGWPMSRMFDEGFGIVARRHHIEYRIPAVLDDEIELATWVYGMRSASATRHYTITRPADGELLARANTVYVWINVESGQPIRVPAHFLEDFAPNIVD